MRNFIEALTSESKNPALPETLNYFGKLIGSWQIDYVECDNSRAIKGEWHFAWALEGMAVQDVIILPGYEYGTSLRIYNPNTCAWDVAYGYTGKIFRLEAKKQEGMIVLTNIDDENRKWIFTDIDDHQFHWLNVTVKENEWHINAKIDGQRVR